MWAPGAVGRGYCQLVVATPTLVRSLRVISVKPGSWVIRNSRSHAVRMSDTGARDSKGIWEGRSRD